MRIENAEAKSKYLNIWVVAEIATGVIQPVTYELLGAARALACCRRSEVWAVVMGTGLTAQSERLFSYGADKVIIVDDNRLKGFNDEIEARTLSRLIDKYKPEVVFAGATARGRALIPRVAVIADCGLTADCTELCIDSVTGDLLQTRPAFGGNIMATIKCANHRPQLATVRPRVMKALDPDITRSGKVLYEKVEDGVTGRIKRIIGTFQSKENTFNLGDARFIISGGRGMKGPEGFRLLYQLAEKVGGAIGASRAAVDSGWIPYSRQIGQTGQTVQAKVYIACGISGQIQHLAGMQSCELIIAIDKNPDTPMMQIADIALVGDLFEVLPELIKEIPGLLSDSKAKYPGLPEG